MESSNQGATSSNATPRGKAHHPLHAWHELLVNLVLQVLGKDVNLGRHVSEEAAAKAYDKAAICARGKHAAKLNFSLTDYSRELEELELKTVAELAPVLRWHSARTACQYVASPAS